MGTEQAEKSVLDNFAEGLIFYKHNNTGSMKSMTPQTLNFVAWMKKFSEFFGQASPDTGQVILSYWLCKATLYKIYLKEVMCPHLSRSSFYANFGKFFGEEFFEESENSIDFEMCNFSRSSSESEELKLLN